MIKEEEFQKLQSNPYFLTYVEGIKDCLNSIKRVTEIATKKYSTGTQKDMLNIFNELVTYLHYTEIQINDLDESLKEDMSGEEACASCGMCKGEEEHYVLKDRKLIKVIFGGRQYVMEL